MTERHQGPAFVTGGSGSLGWHLLAELQRRDLAVGALARFPRAEHAVRAAGAEAVRRRELGSVGRVSFEAGIRDRQRAGDDDQARAAAEGASTR